eukprot:1291502-Pyramimonas_sp.AAC.1
MALQTEYMCAPSRVAIYGSVPPDPVVDEVPPKVKEFDVTVELDHDWWVSRTLMLQALRSRPPGVRLAAAVQRAARDLGFNLVGCQARHSGASADMAARRRTLAE